MSNPETEPKSKRRLALIAGPTASGKTALVLHLAKSRAVTIINADSAQVYSDLPVLSAHPTAAEQASVPHRLFGYLDGAEPCSAAKWAADAKVEISAAYENGSLPVLVGGTGLYLRTLFEGIAPIPAIDVNIRAEIRALSVADAHAHLQKRDPAMAGQIGQSDVSRICRALEVIESTGRSIADWRQEKTGGISNAVELDALILLPPRDWLYSRCDARFELMMEHGGVKEVEALLARGLPADAPVRRAIGVSEIAAMLAGRLSYDEAKERGKIATRQYAKRQFTWFRNQSPTNWQRYEEAIILDEIDTLLQFL